MTTLREAAQQALEALDAYSWEQVDAARTALKAALAEEALQRLTDVSQEIEAALAEPMQHDCEHCNQPLYAAIKCRVCGRVASAEPPCATQECMPSECPNCASLQDQNTELDRKLAEMERKLSELQAAIFQSQGIRD